MGLKEELNNIGTWIQNGGRIKKRTNGKQPIKHCRDLRKLCDHRRVKWRGIWATHICMNEDDCIYQRVITINGNGTKHH